ncbi:helix-turn-helix domain-containing protein [Micromonospora sp. C95]|uniref:winged helix-turn-helix transcriptional regulator n=1 Tax=Micromonospora sp. C95 TaxID=2824882 RepID=UPI001B391A87|nr:helix-turn-helix domain-containing protein [Micromonospora sp. C95]MBQ1023453.1 helix-turn-helix transcriptional regulator [Micromonospora sp. C95]
MALRSDWSGEVCPIARAIDVIGDPWTLLILREALTGARRFDDFKRRLDASDNVLAARLASMVDQGLLEPRPYSSGQRPRREYVPTQAAADAIPVLHAYANWAHRHRPSDAEQPPFEVRCGRCEHPSAGVEVCERCGEPLDIDHGVAWRRPGGRGETAKPTAGADT